MAELKRCPFCGGLAEMTFIYPIYGAGGCEVKCSMCKARVNDFNFTETHIDSEKGTLSTPATIKSISQCIERAINAWNRRDENGIHTIEK